MIGKLAGAGLVLAALSAPVAAQQVRQVGNWMVKVDRDRFDTTKATAIAFTQNQQGIAFGVRCLSGELSFALVERSDHFSGEDEVAVHFRVDQLPAVETRGGPLSPDTIAIDATREMVDQLAAGKEVALRIVLRTVRFDRVFRLGASKRAVAEVLKECPAD